MLRFSGEKIISLFAFHSAKNSALAFSNVSLISEVIVPASQASPGSTTPPAFEAAALTPLAKANAFAFDSTALISFALSVSDKPGIS